MDDTRFAEDLHREEQERRTQEAVDAEIARILMDEEEQANPPDDSQPSSPYFLPASSRSAAEFDADARFAEDLHLEEQVRRAQEDADAEIARILTAEEERASGSGRGLRSQRSE